MTPTAAPSGIYAHRTGDMRTPFSRGCSHGCRQHIGLERIGYSEIRREGYRIRIQNMAEGEGFEPPKACTLVVFKTTAIDHSAIPPAITNIRAIMHRRLASKTLTLRLNSEPDTVRTSSSMDRW